MAIGDGGGSVGITDILTIMKNGVQQLAAIAKSLSSLSASSNPFATKATVAPATSTPNGYFSVKDGDGNTVLIPWYTPGS